MRLIRNGEPLETIVYRWMYNWFMGRKRSITEARKNLPKLVREAEEGNPTELTRRGEPVAILIGRMEYERLVSPAARFGDAYDDLLERFDLGEIGFDPDEVFKDARQRDAGREVEV